MFEQDLLPAVLPHISVQLAETWIGSSPCCCPTCVAGLLMGPVFKAAMCLSLWHSLHLTTAIQSIARWLVEARQQKQIPCCMSRAFHSARDLDLKARHLPRGWHSLWKTHHLAGSHGTESLGAESETSVLSAVSPCPKIGPLVTSGGGTAGGLMSSPLGGLPLEGFKGGLGCDSSAGISIDK